MSCVELGTNLENICGDTERTLQAWDHGLYVPDQTLSFLAQPISFGRERSGSSSLPVAGFR